MRFFRSPSRVFPCLLACLGQIEPIHVAAFVEDQLREHSRPTVKQRLAALRMLFNWIVLSQVLAVNPAHAVRGPKHTQRKGKTPVLTADETRDLLDSIDASSLPGLRDRGLIGLMVYTFARVGAAVSMKVEDYFVQGRRKRSIAQDTPGPGNVPGCRDLVAGCIDSSGYLWLCGGEDVLAIAHGGKSNDL